MVDDRMLDRFMNPPITLGRGYVILDTRPGAINFWRPLGCTDRPLKVLSEFEKTITK